MDYALIIPAAGQGKRMGAGKNKLLIELEGKPVIVHTLQVFEEDPWCREIIVVANQVEISMMENLVYQFQLKKVKKVIAGGSERQYSVAAGIKAVSESNTVLIHDGARPFVKHSNIHALVKKSTQKGAAVLAVPVKDTIKRVDVDAVEETIERSSLWAIQTPQAFRMSLVEKAHAQAEQANFLGTDDASLVERVGETVFVVEGDYLNIKLTTPEDLAFAKAILEMNRGG